jgi:hypothetical protein
MIDIIFNSKIRNIESISAFTDFLKEASIEISMDFKSRFSVDFYYFNCFHKAPNHKNPIEIYTSSSTCPVNAKF